MSPELLWISPPTWDRQVQDSQHWWSWGKWRSIWNNSYDKWCWATKLWQILSVLAFWKMGFFVHRDSSSVVEVDTVKAISFFFMLCQKREGKDILVVNGIVRKWYTKMSCTGLIGWFDGIWWDRRELVGKAHRGNTWPTCKGLLHSAEVGEAQHGKSWTITITKKNQEKQHEPSKPQNTLNNWWWF